MEHELQAEMAAYDARKDDLRSSEGRYCLFKDSDLVGTFPTFDEAYKTGLERFGLVPMLVKKIEQKEATAFIPLLGEEDLLLRITRLVS